MTGKPRSTKRTTTAAGRPATRSTADELRAERLSRKAEAKAATAAVKEAAKLKVQGAVADATKKVAGAIVDQIDGSADPLEPPWWRTTRGRRTKAAKEPISRDAIIDAAIRVLHDEGVDALTIRRLATDLDTGPATLYWHISGKEELGELVYDRIMGEVTLPPADPDRWQEQIADVVRDCYRVLRGHNDAVRLSLGRVPLGPNMLQIMEWLLGITLAAGVPAPVAVYFGDLVGRYVDASVLELSASPAAGHDLSDDEARAMVVQYFASLPPSRFPALTAMAGPMFELGDDERFDLGLDILLRGLEATIADR